MAKINWGFVLIAVVALYLLVPAFKTGVNNVFSGIGGGAAPTTGTTGTTGTTAGAPITCIYDGTTMTVGPMEKKYDPATSVAAEWARVYVEGIDQGLKANQATMTVTYGDKVKMAYAINSSVYYAAIDEFTVPCKASFSSAQVSTSKAYQLYQQNAGLTATVNNDDGSVNAVGNQQAVGAGDSDTEIEVSLKGTYEDGWSPYGKLIMSCQYNATQLDKITAGTYATATCPSTKIDALTNVDNTRQCFEMPGMDGVDKKKNDFTLIVDADDTVNPSNDIVCYVFDQDYYVNSNTNAVEGPAVEDNDEANIGLTTDLSFTVYIS